MSKQYFITATSTEIGKTFYLRKLCKEFEESNKKFFAIKPIISGFNIDDKTNDSNLILQSLKLEINKENLNKISPWRFKEGVSPNIAAKLENKEVELDQVADFCQKNINLAKKHNYNLLIEGAGGVMSPINNKFTFLNLIEKLNIDVILITGDYLGSISHTLTAIRALESLNINIDRIILNSFNKKNSDNFYNYNILKEFTKINLVKTFLE